MNIRVATLALTITLSISTFPIPWSVQAAQPGSQKRGLGLDNPALGPGGQAYLHGILIVKFRQILPRKAAGEWSLPAGMQEIEQRFAVSSIEPIAPDLDLPRKSAGSDLSRVYSLRYESGQDAKEVARVFAARNDVEYAEPHFIYELKATPNDPDYNVFQSAYYNKMSLPAAFDNTKGEDGSVVIAVVDGGTDWDHPDLIANIWNNSDEVIDGTDSDGNGFIDDVQGWSFPNNSNDPTGITPNSRNHGTHVAGIACADTDNSVGVAGASWNAIVMPINAGHPSLDNVVAFGYNGIIYAVQNGANVINCSWGSQGNPSAFEQEVITMAWENDIAVVCAAGNDGNGNPHYPSSYDHVLSVANVSNSDVKVSSSNYGFDVDLAAQGLSIRSTFHGGGYGPLTGTSMSSPHVAAVCALVKTAFPTYSADQVMERVRLTADNIDAQNPAFIGQLGRGRVNASSALTTSTPAILVSGVTYTTTDGDQLIEPGETVTMQVSVINHLDAATSCNFTLTESSSFANVTSGNDAVASIGTLEEVVLAPMTMNVSVNTPVNHTIPMRLDVTASSPSYADFDRFTLTVIPITADHAANEVSTTVTSVGKLGFGVDLGGNGSDGLGFSYAGSANILFEGAMIMATGPGTLVNSARGASQGSGPDDDFQNVASPVITANTNGFDEFGTAEFDDGGGPLDVHVTQESWEMNTSPDDDYITLAYTIQNDGGGDLNNLYVGWYLDWDIDGASFATNRTGYDASRGLGYAWDDGAGPDVFVGVKVLTSPGTTSFRGIWNDQSAAGNPSWGVYDGYTDQEKWETISAGVLHTDAGPEDIAAGIGTGPLTIPSGQSIQVAFAFVGGQDLTDLQNNADAAQDLWDNLPTDVQEPGPVPRRTSLRQNYPNPFNPNTTIAFDLGHTSSVRVQVYGVGGRLIRTLENGVRSAGSHRVRWDGRDDRGLEVASGTYLYRLTVNGNAVTRKMQLIR